MTKSPNPDANTYQGDFGESWLGVVAAGSDLLHGPSGTKDLDKVDVEVTWQGVHGPSYSPCVKAQVKTTDSLPIEDGDYVYDLDAATYNILCRTDHSVGRVLVVIRVSDDGERFTLEQGGTLLVGAGAWVSLEGRTPTSNSSTVRVRLPLRNTLDRAGLQRMVMDHGTNRTTRVPPFEAWGEG